MEQIITHFTDNDLYTFTCQYYILQRYPRAEVEYTFFDRNKTKYPDGFAALLQEQVNGMKSVIITDEEINFMIDKCRFLPRWYVDIFLRGYRFNPNELTISQDAEGYLDVKVKGKWYSTIMWEMPILSTISELTHILQGEMNGYDKNLEYQKAYDKAKKICKNGLLLGDMGTRRRFSFDHHELVIQACAEYMNEQKMIGLTDIEGRITGTSNVYFAMKYNMVPIGTMSHQIISFEEIVSGVFECNYNVMNKWSEVYDGDNGLFLYDCFGDKAFFNNMSKRMAMLYSGLRVDSGNEEEQTQKIIDKYKSLNIDPTTKQVVYSNGLNIKRAVAIHNVVQGKVKDSYGMGTFLTCDVTNVKPMNIVLKLTKGRITELREWHDCVKLSCDKGKTLGNAQKCEYLQSINY